jgi:DNA-binding transcriptional MocR family regulator
MQVGRNNQPQYQGPMQPTPTQSTAQRHEVIKRQVQNFIMQKIGQGATELNIKEAADKLGLTMEEVNGVYQELVAEGWIKPRPQPGAPQQPQQTPQQQTQQPSQGGTPPVQPGTENLPFYER